MRNRLMVCCCLLLIACTPANASDCMRAPNGNVVCGKGDCAKDQYGAVHCARAGGGAMRDRYGTVMCGVGYCATNQSGDVKCSKTPAGAVDLDWYGNVRCLGGCEDASPKRCEPAR